MAAQILLMILTVYLLTGVLFAFPFVFCSFRQNRSPRGAGELRDRLGAGDEADEPVRKDIWFAPQDAVFRISHHW